MEQIVIYLLMVQKLLNLKQKILTAYLLCLRNISKDWLVNIKNTGIKGCVHDFSLDYNALAISDILGINKYLMKKNEIV